MPLKLENRRAAYFERYDRIVKSLAGHYSEMYRRPRQEFLDEGRSHLAWILCNSFGLEGVEKEWTFDESRGGSISTWIYGSIYWHLRCYADARVARWKKEKGSLESSEVRSKVARVGWVERLLSSVGTEGRALLQIVLEAPGELGDVLWRRADRTVVHEGRKTRDYDNVANVSGKPGSKSHKRSGERLRGAVVDYLRGTEEWDECRIERALQEVEAAWSN